MGTRAVYLSKHCLASLKSVEWLAHWLTSAKGQNCEFLQEESSNAGLLGERV